MKRNILGEAEDLIKRYLENKISLENFQFEVEILLGSFNNISKVDFEEIKKIVNKIEIIIYTIPEDMQRDEIVTLIPDIRSFLQNKISGALPCKSRGAMGRTRYVSFGAGLCEIPLAAEGTKGALAVFSVRKEKTVPGLRLCDSRNKLIRIAISPTDTDFMKRLLSLRPC